MGIELIVDLTLNEKLWGTKATVDLNLYQKYGYRCNCRFAFERKIMGLACNCRFEFIPKNMGVKVTVDLTLNKKL